MVVVIDLGDGSHEFFGEYQAIEVDANDDGGFDVKGFRDPAGDPEELFGRVVHILSDKGGVLNTYAGDDECCDDPNCDCHVGGTE